MSPIDPTGTSAFARSGPYRAPGGQTAHSGADKAAAQQSRSTAITATAPVESPAAIAQAQGSEHTRTPPASAKAHPPPLKPMTALLLHELRLQQELADLQEKKDT
ncbi:hypothetical protein U5922_007090 [Aquicoccus sp. G2-2]|uniref:hypothetical protein n=1 Tax=Aquicoccus sp. G2-2 TaxID=3092120 RepID=UPI002ADF4A73|nr:hypothetical protein [Aquicoccus sp. G2-2]MEA1113252.1 hypothetical protein [Aquicoccus sp. G2-2]